MTAHLVKKVLCTCKGRAMTPCDRRFCVKKTGDVHTFAIHSVNPNSCHPRSGRCNCLSRAKSIGLRTGIRCHFPVLNSLCKTTFLSTKGI